jgi:hypothetical protein
MKVPGGTKLAVPFSSFGFLIRQPADYWVQKSFSTRKPADVCWLVAISSSVLGDWQEIISPEHRGTRQGIYIPRSPERVNYFLPLALFYFTMESTLAPIRGAR